MKIRYVIFLLLFAVSCLFIYWGSQPTIVKFSKDFYYDYDLNSIFGNSNAGDIPPEIINFSYNRNFVVVKQKPRSKYPGMYNSPENLNYKNGINETYYWVISLKEKEVYGPMPLEEYNILCKEKNVQLEFKNNKYVKKKSL